MIGAIFLQIILIFLNAAFASAEIAVISLNETKLKKMIKGGNKNAIKLDHLTEQPARFLATIQVAITLSGLLGSAFAADNFAGPLVNVLIDLGISIPKHILNTIAVFGITLILAYFSLVFGELVPKRIAMKKSETLALGMSGVLYTVSKVFAPIVGFLTISTNFILRMIGIDPTEEEEIVSEEEIRMMLAEGKKQGTIQQEENDMIQNIFEFDDITLEEVCTHRKEVIFLRREDPVNTWESIIHNSRHTYYPIYGENQDDILGVLNTKDYFRLNPKDKETIMQKAVEKAYYVPENMKANILFRNMKQHQNYFAIVVDEYGGVSGILTIHDLIEELVGEFDENELTEDIKKIGTDQWKIQGTADLETVQEELQIPMPIEEYDTYSGFLCGLIGRIPDDGETLTCHYQNMEIKICKVADHRISETLVKRISMPKSDDFTLFEDK